MDPRQELFSKVIELVDDIDLEMINLGFFTKENAEHILDLLNKSSTPEDDLFEFLFDLYEEPQENKPFEVLDMSKDIYGLKDLPETAPNIAKSIGYLQDLIKKYQNGEVETMTTVALLKNDKVSIWVPAGLSNNKDKDVDNLYDPLIQKLRENKSYSFLN